MAGISEIILKSGECRYRVRIRVKGFPRFSVSFYEREDAYKWIKENEENFIKNPDKYFKWKRECYLSIKKNNYKLNISCPKYHNCKLR
jgi:hypothetical protein